MKIPQHCLPYLIKRMICCWIWWISMSNSIIWCTVGGHCDGCQGYGGAVLLLILKTCHANSIIHICWYGLSQINLFLWLISYVAKIYFHVSTYLCSSVKHLKLVRQIGLVQSESFLSLRMRTYQARFTVGNYRTWSVNCYMTNGHTCE